MMKHGTEEIEGRAMEMEFVNHMVDFIVKIGTTST